MFRDASVYACGHRGLVGSAVWRARQGIDPSKPDGTPRKLLDVSRLNGLGWKSSIGLREGIASTSEWFLAHA